MNPPGQQNFALDFGKNDLLPAIVRDFTQTIQAPQAGFAPKG
jgi:hypothetical protein